jgi:hypothetical protein
MKKVFNLYLPALLMGAVLFLSSCGEDEDPDPTKPDPSLSVTVNGQSGEVFANASIPLNFVWTAQEAPGGANLREFRLTQSGSNVINPLPNTSGGQALPYSISTTSSNRNSYRDSITIQSGNVLGKTTYVFEVVDRDNKTRSVTIVVNVINQQLATLGSPRAGGTGNPSLNLSANPVSTFSIANSSANASNIDVVFFNGTTNGFTLSAPNNNGDLNQFPALGTPWTSAKATQLKKLNITATQFNADVISFATNWDIAPGTNRITNLAVGDVVAVRTTNNIYGLLLVTATNPNNTDTSTGASLNLSIKVQKP